MGLTPLGLADSVSKNTPAALASVSGLTDLLVPFTLPPSLRLYMSIAPSLSLVLSFFIYIYIYISFLLPLQVVVPVSGPRTCTMLGRIRCTPAAYKSERKTKASQT